MTSPSLSGGRGLAAAVVLLLASVSLAAERRELDVSKGSVAGSVWFVWSAEGAPAYAAVAIGRLPEAPLERAFGLWSTGDTGDAVQAGAIETRELSAITTADRHVLAVKVGPAAFDELRYLIYRWGHEPTAAASPAATCENLLDRVARRLALKAPYRSTLREADPVSYLTDLARSNR